VHNRLSLHPITFHCKNNPLVWPLLWIVEIIPSDYSLTAIAKMVQPFMWERTRESLISCFLLVVPLPVDMACWRCEGFMCRREGWGCGPMINKDDYLNHLGITLLVTNSYETLFA